MCCKTTIHPFVEEIARDVLLIGQFEIAAQGLCSWRRQLAEDESVEAYVETGSLVLSILPVVQFYGDHVNRRVVASVMFEIAAKYAEKVGGTITHRSNVVGCDAGGQKEHEIASYPDSPLLYERLCPGWREVFAKVST